MRPENHAGHHAVSADVLVRAIEPFITTKDVGKRTPGSGLAQVYVPLVTGYPDPAALLPMVAAVLRTLRVRPL
jgi:hypothetical protein